ncbi:hypothetical protein BpHYR1_035579 [Brachionus plicatilis]|uniref:WH2 domain-containing protein n=1 Tax=Brachionus plicatilis TaxID=10195 RepID=A0A3M7R9N9_BRAPC|nr:hypothetical protein BpHYR1_035579 [Brachionus plicatilis]
MPGPPPPPPPPPMLGGPPPPPFLGGLTTAAPPDRNALLKSIADPSKPKLKKVDPSKIKDRSKPIVAGGTVSSAPDPISTKKTSGVVSSGANPMAGMSLQDQLTRRLQERNRPNTSTAPMVQQSNRVEIKSSLAKISHQSCELLKMPK